MAEGDQVSAGGEESVVVVSRMSVRPERRAALLDTMKYLLEPTRVRTGCLGYHFLEDSVDENAFVLLEVWESRADLDRYIRSDSYRHVLAAFELLRERPQFVVYSVSRSEGFEHVEQVRG